MSLRYLNFTVFLRRPSPALRNGAAALALMIALVLVRGCGTPLELSSPNQICPGPDGTLFVVNLGQGNILRIDPATWTITGSIGDGVLEKAYALDLGRDGRVLTANLVEGDVTMDGRIFSSMGVIFAPDGTIASRFGRAESKANSGKGSAIPGDDASLRYVLSGCFAPDGGVVLSDAGRNCLALFGPDLKLKSYFLGATTEAFHSEGTFAPERFFYCTDVRFDPSGRLWTVDSYGCRVKVFGPGRPGGPPFEALGTYPAKPDRDALYFPQSIAFSNAGEAFITDTGNSRVVVLAPDLTPKRTITMPAETGEDPFLISGIALIGERLVLSDSTNSRLIVLGTDGKFERMIGGGAR